jgi:hypothetical protein
MTDYCSLNGTEFTPAAKLLSLNNELVQACVSQWFTEAACNCLLLHTIGKRGSTVFEFDPGPGHDF